jgi:hypothetical protein
MHALHVTGGGNVAAFFWLDSDSVDTNTFNMIVAKTGFDYTRSRRLGRPPVDVTLCTRVEFCLHCLLLLFYIRSFVSSFAVHMHIWFVAAAVENATIFFIKN